MLAGTHAFDVSDSKAFTVGIEGNRAREPGGGDEAEQFRAAGVEPDDGDAVLRAVAGVKGFADGVESECGRAASEGVGLFPARGYGFDDGVGPGVDDAEGVTVGISDDDKLSIR